VLPDWKRSLPCDRLGARGADSYSYVMSNRAFAELVRRHRRLIFKVALRFAPTPSDAEEMAQETLVQLHRKLSSFRGESSLVSWVYAVAVNAALMHLRRNRRHDHSRDEVALQAVADERVPSVDERLERSQLAAVAAAAVQELPDSYRLPFLLRELGDLSAAETAAIAGISSGLVRQRVLRARRMLRRRMLDLVSDGS
jgi:RNA polymerase sigma-70 factor (ECF subfamily)